MLLFLSEQEIENEKLKIGQVQISEENSGLRVQNQKLSEEASYAKELASAAAVELKNLAGEVTKLSLQNAKLEKELLAARESVHSRGAGMQSVNGVNRKFNDGIRHGRKGRFSGRGNDFSGMHSDDFESWNLDPDDLKRELQGRKQREAALEAALAEKEFIEDEYRKKCEEAKKREEALENDLANMWVLVAKLKREDSAISGMNADERHSDGIDHSDPKTNGVEVDRNSILKEREDLDASQVDETPKEEPLVIRLKVNLNCLICLFIVLLCLLYPSAVIILHSLLKFNLWVHLINICLRHVLTIYFWDINVVFVPESRLHFSACRHGYKRWRKRSSNNWEMEMLIPMCAKYVLNHQRQQFFSPVDIFVVSQWSCLHLNCF